MVTRRDKRDRQPNPNFTTQYKGNLIDDDIIDIQIQRAIFLQCINIYSYVAKFYIKFFVPFQSKFAYKPIFNVTM